MPVLRLCQGSPSGRSVGHRQADRLQLPAVGQRRPDPTVEQAHRKPAVGKAIGKATPGVRERRIRPDLKFHGHEVSYLNIVHMRTPLGNDLSKAWRWGERFVQSPKSELTRSMIGSHFRLPIFHLLNSSSVKYTHNLPKFRKYLCELF